MADETEDERTEAAPQAPLQALLAVQDQDLAVDRLAYRRRELPERGTLADLAARIAVLETRRAAVEAARDSLGRRQNEIEEHVASIAARIQAIDARMRQQSGSYRDVQAMSAESDSLARQRRELDDQDLEIMEQLEPMDAEAVAIDGELIALAREREVAEAALTAAESAIDEELEEIRRRRAELVGGIPADLVATYERLRARYDGVGAARLVDGACSGCHLKLPTGERDRVIHSAPGSIVNCEQCGRILVP